MPQNSPILSVSFSGFRFIYKVADWLPLFENGAVGEHMGPALLAPHFEGGQELAEGRSSFTSPLRPFIHWAVYNSLPVF